MTEHTHSEFFSTPPIESLPDDIRTRLEDIQGDQVSAQYFRCDGEKAR